MLKVAANGPLCVPGEQIPHIAPESPPRSALDPHDKVAEVALSMFLAATGTSMHDTSIRGFLKRTGLPLGCLVVALVLVLRAGALRSAELATAPPRTQVVPGTLAAIAYLLLAFKCIDDDSERVNEECANLHVLPVGTLRDVNHREAIALHALHYRVHVSAPVYGAYLSVAEDVADGRISYATAQEVLVVLAALPGV